jgi:transcriptional regulator
MEELSIMERLNKRIEELGAKIDYLKSENVRITDENNSLKNSLVEKDITISKLREMNLE